MVARTIKNIGFNFPVRCNIVDMSAGEVLDTAKHNWMISALPTSDAIEIAADSFYSDSEMLTTARIPKLIFVASGRMEVAPTLISTGEALPVKIKEQNEIISNIDANGATYAPNDLAWALTILEDARCVCLSPNLSGLSSLTAETFTGSIGETFENASTEAKQILIVIKGACEVDGLILPELGGWDLISDTVKQFTATENNTVLCLITGH